MKRLLPVFVLACIAIAGCVLLVFRGDGLPSDFRMLVTADLTSSGASRSFTATLYGNPHSLTGASTYETDPGRSAREEYACALTQDQWLDSVTGEPCLIPIDIPADRSALANALASGMLVPIASCMHKELCYEFVR